MAVNANYYPILALAARQVFARIEITVGKRPDGSFNPDDTLAFLKADRTSAIEELYASAPFWLYVNPELLRLMLQPIVNEHKRIGATGASGGTVLDLGGLSLFSLFAVRRTWHLTGTSYPRVTGYTGNNNMPIEGDTCTWPLFLPED